MKIKAERLNVYTARDVDEVQIVALIDSFVQGIDNIQHLVPNGHADIVSKIRDGAAKVIVTSMNDSINDVIKSFVLADGGPLIDLAMRIDPMRRTQIVHEVVTYHKDKFKFSPIKTLEAAAISSIDNEPKV